ncbi:unnamed protein product [Aspergillus oryzae]|nr:unnamed protein product [Aspergillus oryzae]
MVSNSISIQELDKSDIPSKVEEKLIKLLSEFVDMIASHANIELGRTPKVFWNPQYEKYLRLIKVVPHSHPAAVRKSPETEGPLYRPAKLRRQRIGRLASMFKQKPESDEVLGSTKPRNEHLLKPSPLRHDSSSQGSRCGEEKKGVSRAGVLATMASKALAASSEDPLRHASRESVPHTEPTSSMITPTTPTKQTDRRLSSPEMEEMQRKTTPTSLESITGQPTQMRLFPNTRSIIDLTVKATHTIYHLSKHKDGVPSDVHTRVLQSLQVQPGMSAVCANRNHWSDGSIWVQILEMGESRKDRGTIQNMLEYIGAWEWYSIQVELAKKTVTTKKNKPVKQRGAAKHVMDQIQNRWIGGVGTVTLQEGSSYYQAGSGPAKVDNIIKAIQADAGHMKLLKILAPQLEHLVKIGLPDLHIFYKDLKEAKLVSESELRQLEGRFALEGVEIDRLIRDVNIKVLDQSTFGRDDTIAINDGMEIPCDIFDRLRPGRWLDSWTINALMQISDKPAFVKHDLSIPLDQKSGNNVLRPIKHPLRAWATKMVKFREEARKASGEWVPLVFFCPINHQGQHFSLLEINEREKVIRHYDSMAKVTTRLRMTEVVEEQFGDLKFPYEEVVRTHGYESLSKH